MPTKTTTTTTTMITLFFSVCPTPPLMTPIPMNGRNDTTERVQFSESFHELRSEVFTVKVYTNIMLKLGREGRICQLL